MPTFGIDNLATQRLEEERGGSNERFVDMRVQWVDWTDRRVILDVGGRWDKKLEQYVGDGEQAQIVTLQPAQYDAADWYAGWLGCYVRGGPRPAKFDRKWSAFFIGGRRGGKSDLGVKSAVAFAVASPRRIVFMISPTERETSELEAVIEATVPHSWYHKPESKPLFTFANFSQIRLLSGFKPSSIKGYGRFDLGLLNEGQEVSKVAYMKLRAPIADTGGLLIVAANPPDRAVGRWIMDAYEEAKAGKKTSVLFEFDPRLNPAIDFRALSDMRDDVGEKDYRRDVLGEMIEIGDLVWYAFSPRENVKRPPDIGGVEFTRQFTLRRFGRSFDQLIGIDLQKTPFNAAGVCRLYPDPNDPNDALCWFEDEVIVEGDEDDLIDAFEIRGYDPATTGLIVDASAWWQDNDRTKGRGSEDMFRNRGWRHLYRPDSKARRNPHIFERVQATNGRLKNANGSRRLFFSPECVALIMAMRRWDNSNGVPNRRSEYAHASDAVSYPIWRLWPRKAKKTGANVETLKAKKSQRARDLDNL